MQRKDYRMWARRRHLTQLAVLLSFFFLPVQFDLEAWRFYLFGVVLSRGLFHILFLAAMVPIFALVVSSAFLGKVFCGWVCPQNIFYEMFEAIQSPLRKRFPWYRRRPWMQKGVDLALAIVWGVAISYRLTTYFVGASETFYWILGGGAFLFFVIDTSHLKHRFCASACPYAHLQKAFADEHSLHVEWEDRPGNQCGVCVACEKACYVDLNIRATPFSLDCTNCGACIDACNRVFARKKEPSLLRFGFGEKKKTPYKWFVLALFCALCIGSVYAIVYRPAVQFHVAYSVNHEPERVYDSISANRFMMHVRNFTDLERDYRVDIAEEGYTLCCGEEVFTVPPHTKKRVLLEVHRDQEGDHPFQLPITFVLTDPFSGHPLASEKRLFKHRLRVDGQSLPLR